MKSLFLLLSVCLLTAFAGCSCPSNATPYPQDIPVTIELTWNDPEDKITFDNVTIASGTLDRDYFTSGDGIFPAGSPCFLVSGHIMNGYNEDVWVAYHAEGFDASDNQVSLTLDTGPLPGWGQVYLASYSSADFTLHLSWADQVSLIRVSSQETTRMVPSPSPAANITITVNPCFDDPEGKIIIDNVTIAAGTLDKQYMSLHGKFEPGDPCWLVFGQISNGYDESTWVAYHAGGYDASGNQVSFTLDAGPIVGVNQEFINRKSSVILTLHLSWADNVTSIILSSQRSSQMFP